MQGNKRIKFLPKEISKTYAGLVQILAADCSIEAISKKNFGYLPLKHINLSGNLITKIHDDTFEGLGSLEILYLGK